MLSSSAYGQTSRVQYDTVKVRKNTSIILKDATIKFDKDTVLILPDTLFYKVEKGNFYRNLQERWYQRKFTKGLFNLLFSIPSNDFRLDTTQLIQSEDPYVSFRGKPIGDIRLTKLEPLGTRMDNFDKRPRSVAQKLGNTINFTTRDRVILNNLIFSNGDIIKPSLVADNERILRQLPFIKDARIILLPRDDSDTVDVHVITKDVLALSVDVEARDFDAGVLRVDHKNIFGSGHEIDNRFAVDNDANQVFSYEVRYRIPNIKKTFTSLELGYSDTENRDFTGIKIDKEFVTPEIKFAGGIEWSQQRIRQFQLKNIISDLQFDRDTVNQKFNYQDLWLARAFPVKASDPILWERTRIIISGRLSRINYLIRPNVSLTENKIFHNRFLAIGSIGFSQRRFFKDQLIFGYGRTEDIPYGASFELLGGYEVGEFYDRHYLGLRAAQGTFIGKVGYFASSISLEGFLHQKNWEQGVLRTDLRFISSLVDFNKWKFRQFVTINYTKGLRRFENDFIDIRDRNGIRGLTSNTLRGTQRFLLNLETVSFTPVKVIGFQVAVFGFLDFGFINNGERNIFDERSQTGMGFGFRMRNDNLTFNAIEIRLAFYPNAPVGIEDIDLDLSGNSGFRFDDFLIGRPRINNFR